MTDTQQDDQPQTVAAAIEKRAERDQIELRLENHVGWFDAIMPSHMPARQLVALSVSQFRKIPDLRTAAHANQPAFMAAVAECARLGLVPGDTAFYVPYTNSKSLGGWDVSLLTHWRGEVELIHRTGEVETVVCQVVREHDHFRWEPDVMRVPEHKIMADPDYGQVGLAPRKDRGGITGVYCYVRFKDGGTSFPTVMHYSEVRKHYALAKTKKFWGTWGEGKLHAEPADAWTEDMFRKTAVHKHSDQVPKSPEYLMSKLAQAARIAADQPAEIADAQRRHESDEDGGDSLEPPPVNGDAPGAKTIAGAVESSRQGGKPPKGQRGRDVATLNEMFRDNDLDGPGMREARMLITATAASPDPDSLLPPMLPAGLNAEQAAAAVQALAGMVAELERRGQDVRAGFLSIAEARGWQPAADAMAATEGEPGAGDS